MSGSNFERYDDKAYSYSVNRYPVGVEAILSGLKRCQKPVAQIHLLDAGCGTGNYLQSLAPHVASVVGVDASLGMLESARAKQIPNVKVQQATLQDLPFEDASFDAVMVNFVLHHLDDTHGCDNGFPAVQLALKEIRRVLKPGGALVIQTSSHEQLLDGYWWAELIPQAMAAYKHRYPKLKHLESILSDLGIQDFEHYIEVDEVLQGESYFDPKGPFNKTYRDADSNWTLVSPQELESALNTLKDHEQNGNLDAYVQTRDALRKEIGQMTFMKALVKS